MLELHSKRFFAFAEHQEKSTHGLCYTLSLRGKENDAVLNKVEAIADARIKIHF